MAIQTATTGQLENAQRIAIAECRYTLEHNAPCANLVWPLTLKQGEKSITWPKVGQMTADNLTDGVDIVDTKDIGLTSFDLTTSEIGLKVILTDKLVRQENESVNRIIGKQMGDAMARKKDTDVIALFSALNGGTALGADDKNMIYSNVVAAITWAKSHKLPRPIFIVHHPNALHALRNSLSPVSGTYPIPSGFSETLLKDFWGMTLDGIGIFHDGNIEKITGVDSGYGVIASKEAMGVVESKGFATERERDASLRAWEVVVTADYGCWELDDGYGAPMRFEIADPATNN